jgi:hypothetical protein
MIAPPPSLLIHLLRHIINVSIYNEESKVNQLAVGDCAISPIIEDGKGAQGGGQEENELEE